VATATGKRASRIALSELAPAEYNPQVIEPDNMRRLQASIREHTNTLADWITSDGLRMATTITVNRNGNRIVGGHKRVEALRASGQDWIHAEDITWVDIVPGSATEKALNVALNNREAQGDWDGEKLAQILGDIKLEAGEVYDGLELDLLEASAVSADGRCEGKTHPEAVQEPPDEAASYKGEIYILGNHRLMCGDSASPADVDKLLAGAKIQLINSDPPYNVKVEPRSNNAIAAGLSSFATSTPAGAHHQGFDLERHPEKANATHAKLRPKDRPLANDFVTDEAFDKLLDAWFGNFARVLEPGCGFYIWGGYANLGNYPPFLKKHGLYFSQAIVWDKQHPVLTRKDFLGCFELAFYGWREGAAHRWFGPTNARDLWEIKKVAPQRMIHLTEKPVELAILAMQYSSLPGEHVLDLFGGSGSTLIGAEQTGRKAFLMEIDQLYCDVIRRRWAEFVHGEGCDWQRLSPECA
jgi:DNA modification methylase